MILYLRAFVKDYGLLVQKRIDVLENLTLTIAKVQQQYTPPESGFVAFGMDWSSELAYYAQRKSFAVPPCFTGYARAWDERARFLGDTPHGALVVCPSDSAPTAEAATRRLETEQWWILVGILDCRVLINSNLPSSSRAPRPGTAFLRNATPTQKPADSLPNRVPH